LLLVCDPVLPRVAGLVAGEPVRGSWWAHPKAHEIFRVLEGFEEDEVLVVKLVEKKQTLVHRSLWPELFAIATSREGWQRSGLDRKTNELWKKVERAGTIELNRIAGRTAGDRRELSRRARELEERLLVHGGRVHTASGAHQKILSSWTHLAAAIGVRLAGVDVGAARGVLEERTTGSLPWPRRGQE
jgi:hypothetical protein